MIPKETVDQILDTARIEEVVGDFVTLQRRGISFVACCPFHNEKTPSFYVTPSKGIYKCFGCGKSGSAVGFLMDYDHLSYPDALRYLAKKYHIIVVPGSAFACPGYVRMAYCVSYETIVNSLPEFKKLMEEIKSMK